MVGEVVKNGTFLWAGELEGAVKIVREPVHYGTGDLEDEPEVSDDQERETYYVHYESTTEKGVFNSRSSGYSNLTEAIEAAETAPGIGKTIVWKPSLE